MIRTHILDPGTNELRSGGLELVSDWRASDSNLLWLDIENEPAETKEPLLASFDLHPLAIEDALRTRRPPKLEVFDDVVFMLIRGLDADTEGIDFGIIQLGLFIGERFLITHHQKRSVSANHLFSQVQQRPELMAEGPMALAIRITNYLSRRYIDILLDLEPRLGELEDLVFGEPDDRLLAELTQYKNRLRDIGRIGRYHLQVVRNLQRHVHRTTEDGMEHQLTDLFEQVERTVSLSDLYYEVSKDLTDGYLALAAHRLNRVMQILTVFTVIFVPLTFIAGIYGMNFENMPELGSRWGYFLVLGAMLSIGITLLVLFRRRGWL